MAAFQMCGYHVSHENRMRFNPGMSMVAYIREGLGISDDEIEMLKNQLLE